MTEDDFKLIRHEVAFIKSLLHGLSNARRDRIKQHIDVIVTVCDRNIGLEQRDE